MDYRETHPPASLSAWVKVGWQLAADPATDAGVWIEQLATPDGCLEAIQRDGGRSCWEEEQPVRFLTGLIDRPARFRYTPDAAFRAIRLWPWTWSALGGLPCGDFVNRWVDFRHGGRPVAVLETTLGQETFAWQALEDALASAPRREEILPVAQAILGAQRVADILRNAPCTSRGLQRWFQRHVGMPPRTYLRILRFQETFTAVQGSAEGLTEHAHRAGYADQAHMGREFRALAGDSAGRLKPRAKGPFATGNPGASVE